MKNGIPSSFMGYNKNAVDELINKKNSQLNIQQQDINYLRNENSKLKQQIDSTTKTKLS